MLLSISLILILGMFMGWICQKIKLPSLLGMLITGIVLEPYVLNLLDDSILGISAELRKIALIIIRINCIRGSCYGGCTCSGFAGCCCSENG